MRRLPERMAQALAARLNGEPRAVDRAEAAAESKRCNEPAERDWAVTGAEQFASASAAGRGQRRQRAMPQRPRAARDMQQMLSRAPSIQLADLKKGEAVMLVSTEGTTDVTAITLLAGVEPLLAGSGQPAICSPTGAWARAEPKRRRPVVAHAGIIRNK